MKRYFQKTTSAAPLAVFRIAFGLLIFGSIVRFWLKGWIEELYILPRHYFPFYGFEFVKPLGEYTYLLFFICAVCALMVAIGYLYRIAIIGLFLSFTYIELIDKSTYLNHYYFISMVCLLMIFVPAHAYFSVDAKRNPNISSDQIPSWTLDSIKLLVCMLYFFAGLAKVNSDWLLEAQPLRIWLPAKNDLPIIGKLFNYTWVAFAFSWIGCLYDLSIPFLLLNRFTRPFAYAAVIVFHVLTALLFPIGMFPYIMIVTALVFFSPEFHQKIIDRVASYFKTPTILIRPKKCFQYSRPITKAIVIFLACFFTAQLIMPFRHLLYPDELFWTEEGYRFSWRVMLMEKAGTAQFSVKDNFGNFVMVDNKQFLTPLQEKMMSTQPDMMVQYAQILKDHFQREGFHSPQVYVDSYVVLNGRLSRPFIDPLTDLGKEKDSFDHKPWILPFNDDIKGL